MTTAEKAYNNMAISSIEQLEKAVSEKDVETIKKSFDYSKMDGSLEEKITQDYVIENSIAAFGGIGDLKNSKLTAAIMSGQPLCLNTRQGKVLFMHGNPDGSVMTTQGAAHYTSRAFERDIAPYIDGQDRVFLISCYPGSRESSWMVGKTKIINIGDQSRPLTAICKNGFLSVSYISKKYQELVETKLPVLMQKIAVLFGQQ